MYPINIVLSRLCGPAEVEFGRFFCSRGNLVRGISPSRDVWETYSLESTELHTFHNLGVPTTCYDLPHCAAGMCPNENDVKSIKVRHGH